MAKYLLTQWQAVELFCEIICKYENLRKEEASEGADIKIKPIELSHYQDNNNILQAFRWCENPEYYKPFGEIYLKKVAEKKRIKKNYKKALYDLSLEIKNSIPVTRTRDELLLLVSFIGKPQKIDTYHQLSEWKPNDRQRLLEGKRWWLYDYKEYVDEKGDLITGITRSVVYFDIFSKFSIDTIDQEEKGEYIGEYKIYGPKGTHLLMAGHLKTERARDLHILLDIGDGNFFPTQIALGQFHNIARESIYSGTVIMERFLKQGHQKAAFFQKNDPAIDKVYWEFFEDKYKNRIKTKSNIKTKIELKNWLDSRRK